MRVCLFEDRGAARLAPLALTRPVFQLLCGQSSLAGKQARHFGVRGPGMLVRPHLAEGLRQQSGLPVNDLEWLQDGPIVLVNGRWLPPAGAATELSGPCVALVDGEVAYAVVGPDQLEECTLTNLDECLIWWAEGLPQRLAGGVLIRHPWDLLIHNPTQLEWDFPRARSCPPLGCPPPGLSVVGPRDRLLVAPGVRIEPHVVVDTTAGPVTIDREASIQAFTRIEGPCYVGPYCQVRGARLRGGTTLGPQCRVGGEVEASILHGCANKYHDGFLGHSYVGEWVNLGAGTNNSDLRNDYGEITVIVDGEPVRTGQTKVGCFLGDHSKTAIGTQLNTGTSVGAFCTVVPAGPLPPRYLPPFTSWWKGSLREAADLPALLTTAATVMARRGVVFSEAHAALYAGLFEATAPERRRALHEAETRALRRSA